MKSRGAAAAVLLVAATALGAPERWTDPAPKLPAAAERAPHLVLEAEFVVGSGGGYALAFDAKGERMATGGTHGDIVLWDAATMTPTARWRPYGNAVESMSFSPDGKLLLTGALLSSPERFDEVMLWDVATHSRLAKFVGGTATAFSPDGAWFAYEHREEVVLVDAKSLAEIRRLDTGPIERLAVSRDGRRIAIGGAGRVRVCDVEGEPLAECEVGHGEPVYGVGFLGDGTLVAASRKGAVRIGDVAVSVPESVGALAVSPDGKLVAIGDSAGGIHFFDSSGREVRTLHGPARWTGGIAFRPGTDEIAWIPDGAPVCVARGDRISKFSGNESEIRSVAFTRDGAFVAAAGNETVFFDLAKKTVRTDFATGFVAPGGVAGEIVRGGENDVRRIDAVSGRDAGEIASGGDNEEDEIVYGLWPSPDGRRAVVSRSHRSPLVEGVSETKPFDKIGRVFDGAWSADGRSFFAAAFRRGIDGPRMPNRVSIVRFDATGAVAMTIRLDADALSLDLAPSGNIVALATEKAVELRDAATGELAETIPVRTDWWRFVSEDAALVRKGAGIGLWRRGTEGIVPLVDRPASGTLSPARDRLALVLGGRVFVYRIVR